MKTFNASCTFCHRPLTLNIHDAYDALADPMKLIPLAACNRCADQRVLRQSLVSGISAMCLRLSGARKKDAEAAAEASKPALRQLLQRWLGLSNSWNDGEVVWEDAMLETLLQDPAGYAGVLDGIWKLARRHSPAQPQLAGV